MRRELQLSQRCSSHACYDLRKQIGSSSFLRSPRSHKHSFWLWKTQFFTSVFFFFVRAAFRASAAFPEFSFLTREDRALAAWSNTENTHLHRLVNSMVMKSQCNSMQLIAEWNSAPTFGLCVHFLSHIFPVRSSSSLQFMNLILHVICTVPCFLLGIF